MQRRLDDLIQELFQKLVLMGRLSESMITLALKTLIERNARQTGEILRKENEVNQLQIEVDERALTLTALQQPVGTDVRFLFMASRIASELERLADKAVSIEQKAQQLNQVPPLKPLVSIPIMAQIAQKMVRDSLEALITKNTDLAEAVLREESKVDAFRDQVFRELLTYMMEDPGTITRAISLILISRSLERIGDHATNIAEEVIYMVKGRDVRHHYESKTRLSAQSPAAPKETGGIQPDRIES